ncbi:MAG: GNAT family N-acetyltransferase, partial [Bacteroidales bacterium]|nr:GNAT family N-acetyltransferase [Bacteroidales bacterium]
IVGQFRIRHYLNEALRTGAGHIGYFIAKEFRGKGYATEGLRQTLEVAWREFRDRRRSDRPGEGLPRVTTSEIRSHLRQFRSPDRRICDGYTLKRRKTS